MLSLEKMRQNPHYSFSLEDTSARIDEGAQTILQTLSQDLPLLQEPYRGARQGEICARG